VAVLLPLCLPDIVLCQDNTVNSPDRSVVRSISSSSTQVNKKDPHRVKTDTSPRPPTIQFLTETGKFAPTETQSMRPSLFRHNLARLTSTPFQHGKNDFKDKKSGIFGSLFVDYSSQGTNNHYRSTRLVNGNIMILRRFKNSSGSNYLNLGPSSLAEKEISMKW